MVQMPVPRESLRYAAPKCSTTCPTLDEILRGGIPTRGITELVGEAGAAKTQICLQLLLAAQMPASAGGLGGSAVYIHTEVRDKAI